MLITRIVDVYYNPTKMIYEGLWGTANFTDIYGQYVGRGKQHKPVITTVPPPPKRP